MGKKFVIMEVEQRADQHFYHPISQDMMVDFTQIDPRHVIDGERLRYGIAKEGMTGFYAKEGFREVRFGGQDLLILDPPKPQEEDEWEKWIGEGAYIVGKCKDQFNLGEEFIDWLRRWPRRDK